MLVFTIPNQVYGLAPGKVGLELIGYWISGFEPRYDVRQLDEDGNASGSLANSYLTDLPGFPDVDDPVGVPFRVQMPLDTLIPDDGPYAVLSDSTLAGAFAGISRTMLTRVSWLTGVVPPLRMNQRDDGAGIIGHARFQQLGGSRSSSQQTGARLLGNNTYL